MLKRILLFLVLSATTQAIGGLNYLDAYINLFLKKFKSSAERITVHGYPAETHEVETEDGYVLTMFRIPHSPQLNNAKEKRPAVLIQHGLLSCSDCFLLNGPDNSLAYNYADAGYDVWLGNARGNIYSTNSTKKYIYHRDFWAFSWHEIGAIDLPAMIDHILNITGEGAVHYVGHSQGCTAFFVMGSFRAEYNAKIKTVHMLAPPIFMGNTRNPVLKLLALFLGTPGLLTNIVQNRLFWPMNKLVQRILDTVCNGYPIPLQYCPMLTQLIGQIMKNMNKSAIPQLLETHPAGISTNQAIHYLQLYRSNGFHQYDWGPSRNLARYGTKQPPSYNISRITSKLYLYVGPADRTVRMKDVNRLVPLLPQLVELNVISPKSWGHWDFISSIRVKEVINDRIIAASRAYDGREQSQDPDNG